jgi:LysM repeat protein
MVENCNNFYYVVADDGCYDIAAKFSISLDEFYAWNPYVQDTCARLWPKTYVCVGLIGSTPTPTPTPKPSATPSKTSSSTTKTTPTNGITTPSPIQSGMVTNCNKFYLVQGGDGCWDIATKNSITPEQFSLWNPAIGTDCAKLYPNNYVCVSIIGFAPATSSTLKTTAKPTSTIPYIPPTTCTFNLSKGEYICPNSTLTTARPTSTKPGNGIATPTPIQTGMTTNCKKFYKVKSGDGCWAIADANQIALDDFYKWNPAVGSGCQTLWPDNYVCIGI